MRPSRSISRQRALDYSYIAATIVFTVYGQVVIKWRMDSIGSVSGDPAQVFWAMLSMVFDPWILSALFAAFLASLAWMAAMTRFALSHAYPFMSLTFVLVVLAAGLLGEHISMVKLFGIFLIVVGTSIASRG
jgi:drug/metabolite transporter (DMT)-like permease